MSLSGRSACPCLPIVGVESSLRCLHKVITTVMFYFKIKQCILHIQGLVWSVFLLPNYFRSADVFKICGAMQFLSGELLFNYHLLLLLRSMKVPALQSVYSLFLLDGTTKRFEQSADLR